MGVRRGEPSFTITGICNQKDGTVGLKKHEDSASHMEAMEVMVIIPSSCPDAAERFSKEHAAQKKDNRHCLLRKLTNCIFKANRVLHSIMIAMKVTPI